MQEMRNIKVTLYGMGHFPSWLTPREGDTFGLTDVDGALHSRVGDRLLFLEFKPIGWNRLKDAQDEHFRSISRRPGQVAVAVFDPFWDTTSRERFPRDRVLRFQIYANGKRGKDQYATVEEFDNYVSDWYHGGGPLNAPDLDVTEQLAEMMAAGATAAEIAAVFAFYRKL